ncbi:MAG: hypothetical protein ACXAEN_26000, partial [Candidatus Thorarchaeota archaeon]
NTRVWFEEDITDNTADGVLLTGSPVLGFEEFGPLGSVESLVAFTSLGQFFYDVTNNVWVDITQEAASTYAITAADHTDPYLLTVAGNHEHHFFAGCVIQVSGSTANDGFYTVVSSTFGAATVITVTEALTDSTADGTIYAVDFSEVGVATAAPTNTLRVDSVDVTADFPVGSRFFVRDSTGNNGVYTVKTVAFSTHTTITTHEDLPDGTDDGRVSPRESLTYTEGTLIDWAVLTDVNSRRLLMTNGVEPPIDWSGLATSNPDHFVRWVPLFTNFDTCKTLRVFKEHLLLGNVTTSTSEPELVAWSKPGDFNDFNTGTSGSQILYELKGGIVGMETLGDRIVIYSSDAIANGAYVGSPFIFVFETIIPRGTRLASPNSVVSINVGHVFASEENFYLFDGSRGMRTLGDAIRNDYRDVKDQENIHRVAALNDYSKKTIYLALPSTDSGNIIYSVEYDAFDLAQRVWAKETYADNPRAFGFFTNQSTTTWTDTTQETAAYPSGVLWEEEEGIWGNEGDQKDFPMRVFGDEFGFVYTLSEAYLSDAGVSTDGYYETGDFTIPQQFLSTIGRWGELEFEASGSSVDVYMSTELAGSFKFIETVTIDGGFTTFQIPMDITARTMRVRFEFSGSFSLRWVRLWVNPMSAR